MDKNTSKKLIQEQLSVLDAASQVLSESYKRVESVFKKKRIRLSVEEKESCEALTARFARLCDFLFQRAFRTLDQLELQDEGSGIDRLNRMEKRGVITSAALWKELRELRNEIAHEYLIEKSDRVLREAFKQAPELLRVVTSYKRYLKARKLI